MYTVKQIADWFIARSRADIRLDDEAEPITKMKLQKLLYFAQGVNLAINNQRLFDSKLYAFDHGPITKEIQNDYSGKDLPEFKSSIPDKRANELAHNYDNISQDLSASEVLGFVWTEYGQVYSF